MFSDDDVGEEVASKIKVDPDIFEPKVDVEIRKMGPFLYEARINVKGFLDDVLVEQEKFITFKLGKVSCDACMKLVSNYREGIIQLRASSNEEAEEMYRLTKGLIEKERANDSLSGIVKTIKSKNGYELWIGSKKAAAKISRYVAKLYKVRVKSSKQLIGEDQAGEFNFRYTFCIRK
jgi:NMD protein affecting ribosome stability and mRNA decay